MAICRRRLARVPTWACLTALGLPQRFPHCRRAPSEHPAGPFMTTVRTVAPAVPAAPEEVDGHAPPESVHPSAALLLTGEIAEHPSPQAILTHIAIQRPSSFTSRS